MNKNEFITAVSGKTGFTKKATEVFLSAAIETVEETVKNGDSVQLVGFGTFELRDRAEKKARNLNSGEEVIVPAGKTPAFKPSASFKEFVK